MMFMEGQILIGALETLVFLAGTLLSVGIAYGALKKKVEELKESASKDIRPELKQLADSLPRLEERIAGSVDQITDIEQSFSSMRSRLGGMELATASVRVTVDQLGARVRHVDELVQTVHTSLVRAEERNTSLDRSLSRVEMGLALFDSLRDRFKVVEARLEVFWRDRYVVSNSPRQLNEYGKSVLEKSGIKEYVDEYYDELNKEIEDAEPQNPYDAEQLIVDAVRALPREHPEIVNDLKNGAFKTGADFYGVLYVGALYLRDLLMPELGFAPHDFSGQDGASESTFLMHPPQQGLI